MILDVIAIILALLCIIRGIKKGFVKSFFGTFSFIIALILTVMTLDAATGYVSQTTFGETIYENTNVNITHYLKEFGETSPINTLVDMENIFESVEQTENELSEKTGDIIIKAITALGLFVIYLILLKILTYILNLIVKLPVLSLFNKAGGVISGVVNAYIVLILLSCIVTALIPSSFGTQIAEWLENSVIVSFFCEKNPLLKG